MKNNEGDTAPEFPELDGVPLTMDSLEHVEEDDVDEFGVTAVEDGVEESFQEEHDNAAVSASEDFEEAVEAVRENIAQNGVQEPGEGVEVLPGEDFTRFLMEEYGKGAETPEIEEEVEKYGDDQVGEFEEEASLTVGDVDYLESIDPEDWGLLGWRIEPSRDDDGKVLKGEAARANPGSLILENEDGETVHSMLLTPQVRQDLLVALTQLGKIYADPVPASKTAKDYLDRIVQWHLNHKVLGSVSAFFILAFITFVIIGFFTVN